MGTRFGDIQSGSERGSFRGDGARQAGGQGDPSRRSPLAEARQAQEVSRLLGWFSLGLGTAQIAAPGAVARAIGVPDGPRTRALMRFVGLRELAAGVGIFSDRWPREWVWARVAGDAMDLSLLAAALSAPHAEPSRVMAAMAAVAGITALDVRTGVQLSSGPAANAGRSGEKHVMDFKRAITINRSADELYSFWHNFENLPRFMKHLEAVQVHDGRRSHWKAKAPAGMSVEWDAEMVDDRPNELIAWRSLEGAEVKNSGSVRFQPAPGGRATEVHVDLHYAPPGGPIGAAFAKLFGEEPSQQVAEDLRRFKQVMEIGEVVVSDATIHDNSLFQRPAHPPETERSNTVGS